MHRPISSAMPCKSCPSLRVSDGVRAEELWVEIVANLCIGIVGWLFLNGVLGPSYVQDAMLHNTLLTLTSQSPSVVLNFIPLGPRDPNVDADHRQPNRTHC